MKKKIKDGFEIVSDSVSDAAKSMSSSFSYNAKKHKGTIQSTSKSFFDGLTKFLGAIANIFAKTIGVFLMFFSAFILIVLVLGFFSVGVNNILNIPGIEYVYVMNAGGTPVWLATLMIFFAIGIPFFFLFYLSLKILVKNLKSIGNIAKFSLLGLWLFSVLGLIVIGVREASEHSFSEKVRKKEILSVTAKDTLRIQMNNDNRFRSYGEFKLIDNDNGDLMMYRDDINIIIKSTTNETASILIEKHANGNDYKSALSKADHIQYNYSFNNNILSLDSSLSNPMSDKFRDQEVDVILYLPKGMIVVADRSVSRFNTYNSIINRKHYNHTLRVEKNGVTCLDCTKELKIKVKTPKVKIDEDGVEINGEDAKLKIDKHGVKLESKELKMIIDERGVDVEEKEI